MFKTKAFAPAKVGKQFTVTKEKSLDYTIGDRVRHMKFGEGLVRDITEGGSDFEVTVEFRHSGNKENVCLICQAQKNIEFI